MRIRFLLDEHFPKAAAEGLRRKGVDALTIQEAERAGLTDREQLDYAREHGYVIVTADRDFLRLVAEGNEHCGIIFMNRDKVPVGPTVEALLFTSLVVKAEDMVGHVEFF